MGTIRLCSLTVSGYGGGTADDGYRGAFCEGYVAMTGGIVSVATLVGRRDAVRPPGGGGERFFIVGCR